MNDITICNNVHWVGVLNPLMRVFDVILKTQYGTTYNSYLIKGSKKIALIDTCHKDFENIFFSNINNICKISEIDYLIVNHCEPDHSGLIAKLVKLNPKITIFCTKQSSIFLKNITNSNKLNFHIIKDNEILDLGDKTLQFVVAPFLHWPDSMFTYLKEDKIVFTCDFLGSHFCDPIMEDKLIKNENGFLSSVKQYYECIFKPFKTHVISGLKKLNELDFVKVCPSHGPILNKKNGLLNEIILMYTKLANEKNSNFIPVFYCSAYGNTKLIAETISKTIKKNKSSVSCEIYEVNELNKFQQESLINNCVAFCVGSPTINRNLLSPVINLLGNIDAINSRNKPVLTFGSYGWSGEAINIMNNLLSNIGLHVFEFSPKICFLPTASDLKNVEEITKKFINNI